jgi:hypothetical protein
MDGQNGRDKYDVPHVNINVDGCNGNNGAHAQATSGAQCLDALSSAIGLDGLSCSSK